MARNSTYTKPVGWMDTVIITRSGLAQVDGRTFGIRIRMTQTKRDELPTNASKMLVMRKLSRPIWVMRIYAQLFTVRYDQLIHAWREINRAETELLQ